MLLVVVGRHDEAKIDRRMPAVGDDREQDIVAGLRRSLAHLDRLDAGVEDLLIGLERRRGLGGQDLPSTRGDIRHFDVFAEIRRQDDVGEGAEHGDQFRDIDEAREAADRLVFAGRLDLQLGRRIAEAGRPGIEFVQTALGESLVAKQALDREHLAECVGDRRARGEHQGAARVLRFEEPGLHIEVPGALRAVRINALQRRHIRGEGKLPELLRFIDGDLVDADLGDGEQIVLSGRKPFQPFLQSFLQTLETLARDAVLAVDLGQQILVEFQLIVDHLLFEGRRHGDEPERRVRDDDRVPGGRRRARQKARPLVLGEIRLVGNENAGIRIERQKLTGSLRQAMAGHDQHGLGDQPQAALRPDRAASSLEGMRHEGASPPEPPPSWLRAVPHR